MFTAKYIHVGDEYVDQIIDVVVYKMFLVLSTAALILGTTWLITELRFQYQSQGGKSRFQGREPPTLPYALPWVGSALKMLSPHDLYASAK